MIEDSIANSARCQGVHPAFDGAFTLLPSFDAKTLQDGRIELEAGVFANVQAYAPPARSDS